MQTKVGKGSREEQGGVEYKKIGKEKNVLGAHWQGGKASCPFDHKTAQHAQGTTQWQGILLLLPASCISLI